MRLKEFLDEIKPYLNPNDRPGNRQIFIDSSDMLRKEGRITKWQYNNWCCPSTLMFYSKREIELNKRHKHR